MLVTKLFVFLFLFPGTKPAAEADNKTEYEVVVEKRHIFLSGYIISYKGKNAQIVYNHDMKRFFVSFFGFIVVIGLGVFFLSVSYRESEVQNQPEKPVLAETQTPDEAAIRKEIGQMFIVGFRGTSAPADSYIADAIKNLNVGGVILFDYDVPTKTKGRNIADPEQTKRLVSQLSSYATTPLLVSVDAEGGLVNRLKPAYGFVDIPSHEDLGKGLPAKTRETAEILGKQLSDLGFNLNFAPVVDVNVNPENPIIGKLGRSFGDDETIVTEHAKSFIDGLRTRGILSSIKHYPGHGSSDADSHLGMVDVTDSYEERELEPFKALIADGSADMVMIAHVFDRNIDPDYPASLSEKFISDILRKNLGFDGVVISDDMDMGAIRKNYGFEDAVVRAVKAGNDLIIVSNNGDIYDESSPERAIEAVLNAVKSGEIPLSSIEGSAARITALKERVQ